MRLLLVELDEITRDILRAALEAREGIRVVGEIDDCDRLLGAIHDLAVDLVVWRIDGDVADANPNLFLEYPRVKVLALGRGGGGVLWQMRPEQVPLGEMSPSILVAAIEKVFLH